MFLAPLNPIELVCRLFLFVVILGDGIGDAIDEMLVSQPLGLVI